MFGFDRTEMALLKRLNTPCKIQDFLDTLPANKERGGTTCLSPRRVLRERRAHCIEGAILAAAALWIAGERPLLMDLQSARHDDDHVVALFRRHGRWGAISKTNHAVLRYREPVYRDVRELAMSYFHEYFDNRGLKTLRSYAGPFDLSRVRPYDWLVSEKNLWHIAEALNDAPHYDILTRSQIAGLRRADRIEINAGKLTEW